MKLAPIVLFAYKRFWHLKQTVDALSKNYQANESEIFIFSDGAKDVSDREKVEEVRKYLAEINGFGKIHLIFRPVHLGLANSIISGVSEIFKRYTKLIVVEDDLISSPNFLTFMNKTLEIYESDKRIFSVTGFTYPNITGQTYGKPVYLGYRASSWGWGTWRDRWNKADWQVKDFEQFSNDYIEQEKFARGGEDLYGMLEYQMKGYIDSWAIRWCYAHYKNDAYCLYPTISKVKNIGLDRSGTHKTKLSMDIILDTSKNALIKLPKHILPNPEILQNFSRYHKKSLKTKIIERGKGLIFYYLKRLNISI